ncbi:MAG TPA: type I DNA topoisomerase [Stellaceae bacterium]|nr:type I DNA topoisomerase [Stellaceae bacterium]
MNVVIVESPAKAKTINKYLGRDYKVVASYGHVRDLPAKDGSVLPDADFAMSWAVDGKSEKHVKAMAEAVRGADRLYLATDPDREGEAISWHINEVLKGRRALKGVDVKRVVFNEVTRSAVLDAFTKPREIDIELVDAYLARRALDYLVGFTLSPVLWRKLPGSRSAGRVQSVALRLICEREAEIEAFKPREYWTVEAEFTTEKGDKFTARLARLDGKKLDRYDLDNEAKARAAADAILGAPGFSVTAIERRQTRRNPFPPFTTSTLQQEASRKLGFGASRTMRLAQQLYEGIDIGGDTVGLITYMRTDGVAIAGEAIAAARGLIASEFGDRYLPNAPRVYRSPAKNAQEAHEAVRPTDLTRKPADVARYLDSDHRRLYELIWKRTIASQMESAVLDQVGIDIADPSGRVGLHATGTTIAFDGFLKLYQEDRDDAGDDEENRRLPPMREKENLARGAVTPSQHFTQPPPRYSEASLVKKLEELGIGRPSTYASILQVLQDREYVKLDKRRFIPEDRGRLVTAFLTSFFERYVEYNFTADLENQLDDISGGRIDWKEVLRRFWEDFSRAIDGTKDLKIGEVLKSLDEELGRHFFPDDGSGRNPRLCPVCGEGQLSLKLGRFGAFIGCSNYPNCRYTRALGIEADSDGKPPPAPDTELGTDPASGLSVSLKKGPYGQYIQLGGGDAPNGGDKPKRVALPRGLDPSSLDLDMALKLLALPREIGRDPESGEPITAGSGRFGPYIKRAAQFVSLGADDDVLNIGLNRAVTLLAEAKTGGRRGPQLLRELGEHPEGSIVGLYRGRYGPYVGHDGLIASLPRAADPDRFTLDEALPLLAAQKAKGKTPRKPRAASSERPGRAAAATNGTARRTSTKSSAKKTPARGKTAAKSGKAKATKPRRAASSRSANP